MICGIGLGELDNYNWWWSIAMQGVGAAVVGGLVAIGALFIGFRAERRIGAEAALVGDARTALGDCVTLATLLKVPDASRDERLVLEAVLRWANNLNLVIVGTHGRHRDFSDFLDQERRKVLDHESQFFTGVGPELKGPLATIEVNLVGWIAAPKKWTLTPDVLTAQQMNRKQRR